MAVLLLCPLMEEDLLADRRDRGIDGHDEVWDGLYVIPPIVDIDHQRIVTGLIRAFFGALGMDDRHDVYPGINVTDRQDDWTQNYRVPDMAVYLEGTQAKNCDTHYFGGPDFTVEIMTPHDRSREKLPFYAKVGVRELLLIDRDPWALELFRLEQDELKKVGRVVPDDADVLESQVLSVRFRLVSAEPRPVIEITRIDGSQQWTA